MLNQLKPFISKLFSRIIIFRKTYPKVSYTTKDHKQVDDIVRASTAVNKWKRMKKWSDIELLKITKEDPDFVNVLTWNKDLYNLLGRDIAFESSSKRKARTKSIIDSKDKIITKWFK